MPESLQHMPKDGRRLPMANLHMLVATRHMQMQTTSLCGMALLKQLQILYILEMMEYTHPASTKDMERSISIQWEASAGSTLVTSRSTRS